jgi:Sec-independent protein translocase protein TatA
MNQIGFPELVVIFTVAMLLFWGKNIPDIAMKLEEALNNLRGGPGSPTHPIPANDSKLLTRKRRHSDN